MSNCHHCERREANCHSGCADYAQWAEEERENKAKQKAFEKSKFRSREKTAGFDRVRDKTAAQIARGRAHVR